MQFVQRKIGSLAAEGNAAPVYLEYSIVQISLRISKLAVYRPCSGDIGDIGPPFL
jgi:hypothetical protein